LKDLARKAFAGSVQKLMIRAVEEGGMNEEELVEIQKLINAFCKDKRGDNERIMAIAGRRPMNSSGLAGCFCIRSGLGARRGITGGLRRVFAAQVSQCALSGG